MPNPFIIDKKHWHFPLLLAVALPRAVRGALWAPRTALEALFWMD